MKRKPFILLCCALLCITALTANAQILGDANADNRVTIVDALMVAQYTVNLTPDNFHAEYADTNCSGNISIVDALLIAQFTVGAINSFPCSLATPTPPPAARSHVFLLLGQSNMAGYPPAQNSDKVPNDRILALGYQDCSRNGSRNNQWYVAVAPLHECSGALGPGDWFAKTLIDYYPAGDTIRLVPCAISGASINRFLKSGGDKYNWILQRAKLAQQAGGVIEGILFHQGESDSGQTDWPGRVRTLLNDLKADLGIGDVPFLAGELLYSGGCSGHNTLINQLPNYIPNCHIVSAAGLAVDPSDTQWRLHFGHDAQVTFGKRYAATMVTALGL